MNISSLQAITSFSVAIPFLIKSCAFSSHTYVPFANPKTLIKSSKVVGLVSKIIFLINSLSSSGIPNRIVVGSILVNSFSLNKIEGISFPSISSFNKL